MFFKELAIKEFKFLNISKYYIKLKIDKKLFYRLIYSLKFIKLEIFKIYIKTNLVNNFI